MGNIAPVIRGRLLRPWLTTLVLAVLLAVVAGVAVSLVPSWSRTDSPVSSSRELANLQTLGRALRLHAEEHDGKFPGSIAAIEWRQNLPGLDRAGLPAAVSQFHDPNTGREHRWTYYPGHTLSDSPDTILVAAPFPIGKEKDQRLIVRLNSVAEMIRESDFQKIVVEQAANAPVNP